MDGRSGGRTNLRRPHARLAATYNFNHSHFTRQAGRNSRQQCRSRRTDPGGWRFDSGPDWCNFWLYFLLFLPVFSKFNMRGESNENATEASIIPSTHYHFERGGELTINCLSNA